jgi:hypothetical protein
MTSSSPFIQVSNDRVEVTTASGGTSYTVCDMPQEFFSWQLRSRSAVFEGIADGKPIADFHAHLPVVATSNDELSFPIHTATKATRLLPLDEHLEE